MFNDTAIRRLVVKIIPDPIISVQINNLYYQFVSLMLVVVVAVVVLEDGVGDALVQRALVDARLAVAQPVRVQPEAGLIVEPARSGLECRNSLIRSQMRIHM